MKILPNRSVRSIIRKFLNIATKDELIQLSEGEFRLDIHLSHFENIVLKRIHHIPISNHPYTSKSIDLKHHPNDVKTILSLFTYENHP